MDDDPGQLRVRLERIASVRYGDELRDRFPIAADPDTLTALFDRSQERRQPGLRLVGVDRDHAVSLARLDPERKSERRLTRAFSKSGGEDPTTPGLRQAAGRLRGV